MKQRIVIKVQIKCGKCRKEAMKISASANGVISVVIQGSDRDEIVVVGNEVDSVALCSALRKKVGSAVLVSVEEIKDTPKSEVKKGKSKEKKKGVKKKQEEMKKSETTLSASVASAYNCYPYPAEQNYFCPSPQFHTSNYSSDEDNSVCSIM